MKNKKYFISLVLVAVITLVATYGLISVLHLGNSALETKTVAVKNVGEDIAADGSIHSENEATLHFQTGGKLVYLPFKEGDAVSAGQTIAMLDLRAIQNQIQSAADAYKNQKINYDITNDFNGNRSLDDTGLSTSARRQLETAVNTLDQANLAVTIQQLAQEQAALTAPFAGIITQEDVTTPFVNITPLTTFSVADPSMPVFRAFVLAQDIDFVNAGATVKITINGANKIITGTVERIYPQKTNVNGVDGYNVDVTSPDLKTVGKLGLGGSVLIRSNVRENVTLVPSWTVVGHKYVWVAQGNKPVLKKVTLGREHGDEIEVTDGLSPQDNVIINPQSVAGKVYQIL